VALYKVRLFVEKGSDSGEVKERRRREKSKAGMGAY